MLCHGRGERGGFLSVTADSFVVRDFLRDLPPRLPDYADECRVIPGWNLLSAGLDEPEIDCGL